MNIANLFKALPALQKAGVTPHIIGKHGIGKSSIVKQYAKQIGYQVLDLRLGQMADAGDLLGLADFVRNEAGQAVATRFMRPAWLPTSGKWIIFLDEVNRASKDILQAIFQLVLDRRIHEYVLADEIFIISASNPPTGDYAVLDFNDAAFQDRFVHIKLEPTVKEFLDYARTQDVNPLMLDFFADQPDMLEDSKLEDFNLDFVKPSRRSAMVLARLEKTGMPDNILREVAMGVMGPISSIAYFAFLENNDVRLTGQEVLSAFKKNLKKLEKITKKENPRLDIVNAINEDIERIVKESKELSQTTADNLIEYLKMVPLDSAYGMVKRIVSLESTRKIKVNGNIDEKYFHHHPELIEYIKTISQAVSAEKEKDSQKKEKKLDK